jgi:hypothetical protein
MIGETRKYKTAHSKNENLEKFLTMLLHACVRVWANDFSITSKNSFETPVKKKSN